MASAYAIPAELVGRLSVGTCSWKYDSWKGLVYEPGKRYRADDYLPDYAKQPKSSERHASEPNPHFLSVDLLNRILETLKPMHGKLGPIMFQFEYLNRQKMPSLVVFLDRLHEFFEQAPAGFQYAIEIRNPNYLQDEFPGFLGQHGLGFVLLDCYYMPPIAEVAAEVDIRTARSPSSACMVPTEGESRNRPRCVGQDREPKAMAQGDGGHHQQKLESAWTRMST